MQNYKIIRGRRLKVVHRKRLARDVLYDAMINFESKAQRILEVMITILKSQNKTNYQELKIMYTEFRKCSELACDYASKLAPYQSPKLESIEVKSEIEHKYVIRVPHQMKTIEDWSKATGATKLVKQIEETNLNKAKYGTESMKYDAETNTYEEIEGDYVEPGMVH